MQRFYIPTALSSIQIIEGEIYHQLTKVLRAKVGDTIILFSEESGEYYYSISEISKKYIHLIQGAYIRGNEENISKNIILYQALPNKYEKIEWIIEKNIEIGINKIIFFRADRSQKLIITDTKIKRFQKIAQEAVEQCGGLSIPEILFLDSKLHVLLSSIGTTSTLVTLSTSTGYGKVSDIPLATQYTLFVGPEGGWSDEEEEFMNKNDFINVHFGNRVYRTETAGMLLNFGLRYK